MNNKTIIPKLVGLSTNIKKISSFELCDDINFFQNGMDYNYHYSLLIKGSLNESIIEQRIGNIFFTNNDSIYYYNKILGFTFYFEYNFINKTFIASNIYAKLPIQIGGILPIGKHISSIIRNDLFSDGILTILGASFKYNEKNYIVFGPSYSGKTTLINKIIKKGGTYISEDIVIFNIKNNELFPSSYTKNSNRNSNIELINNLNKSSTKKQKDLKFSLDQIIYLGEEKLFNNYIKIHGLNFLDNPFMKILAYKKLSLKNIYSKFDSYISKIKGFPIIYETDLNNIINKIGK